VKKKGKAEEKRYFAKNQGVIMNLLQRKQRLDAPDHSLSKPPSFQSFGLP